MLNQEIEQLTSCLRPLFSGNRSRIECMAAIILGMLSAGSVNLSKISNHVQCGLKFNSMYKRIQGFFTEFPLSLTEVALFVLSFLNFTNNPITLTFDRTNWKFGKHNINYFVLAICYRTVAIPVLWRSLAKQGCSSDSERIELLERFKNLWGFERVVDLLGDREFASKQLLDYLHEHNVPYTLRIKGNLTVRNKGKMTNISMLFPHLLCGEALVLKDKLILGVVTNIAATRCANGDITIAITNTKSEEAIGRYENRQQIERMFSCLKTRGFNLEDTHITNPDKLERLLGVVTIAFCWAYKMGDQIDQCNPTPRKKHGRRIRSIFKTGHVYLTNLISGVGRKSCEYANVFALLFHKDMSSRPHINWVYL